MQLHLSKIIRNCNIKKIINMFCYERDNYELNIIKYGNDKKHTVTFI